MAFAGHGRGNCFSLLCKKRLLEARGGQTLTQYLLQQPAVHTRPRSSGPLSLLVARGRLGRGGMLHLSLQPRHSTVPFETTVPKHDEGAGEGQGGENPEGAPPAEAGETSQGFPDLPRLPMSAPFRSLLLVVTGKAFSPSSVPIWPLCPRLQLVFRREGSTCLPAILLGVHMTTVWRKRKTTQGVGKALPFTAKGNALWSKTPPRMRCKVAVLPRKLPGGGRAIRGTIERSSVDGALRLLSRSAQPRYPDRA